MSATTNFKIRLTSGSGEPSVPPIDAWPVGLGTNTIDAPPSVQWPTPTGIDGNGYPAGIIGRPRAEVGRPRINATGYAYYNNFFASATDEYALVKVSLLDPRTQAWSVWSGVMYRPTHGTPMIAGVGGPEFTNFRVKFENLVETSW